MAWALCFTHKLLFFITSLYKALVDLRLAKRDWLNKSTSSYFKMSSCLFLRYFSWESKVSLSHLYFLSIFLTIAYFFEKIKKRISRIKSTPSTCNKITELRIGGPIVSKLKSEPKLRTSKEANNQWRVIWR